MSEKMDVLGRGNFIDKLEQLVDMLAKQKQGCCFGIDGMWGCGKSFVLEQFEERLRLIQSENTADNMYYVFHYDCWKYDYYDEPAIAIIAAMLDDIDRELGLFSEDVENAGKLAILTVKKTLGKIASELCKNKIGIDLVEIASDVLEEHDNDKVDSFDSLYGFKRALEETRNGMKEIASKKTVVIVVDELDRCLPTYSIKVLERLHHIFYGVDNVIVIVSMDKSQLEHSIKSIYGEIDVDTYLRKFISFKISLDTGEASQYAEKFYEYFSMFAFSLREKEEVEIFLSDILAGLDMRTQERIFNKAKIIHKLVQTDIVRDCSIITFEMLYLTVSMKMKNKDLHWLSRIWTSHFVSIEQTLGKEYYDMLSTYGNRVCGSSSSDGLRVINDTIIGRTFFWLATLYRNACGQYEYITYPQADTESISLVERFADLVNIVDVD